MPLRTVYIFGGQSLGEIVPADKLRIAVEYDDNVGDHIMRSWQQENSTDFADLKQALEIGIALFTDQDYDVWTPIREAARAPFISVRKVKVVKHPRFSL